MLYHRRFTFERWFYEQFNFVLDSLFWFFVAWVTPLDVTDAILLFIASNVYTLLVDQRDRANDLVGKDEYTQIIKDRRESQERH